MLEAVSDDFAMLNDMTEMPDPFEPAPYPMSNVLEEGRRLHDGLVDAGHYRAAMRVVETLDRRELAWLAMYVAAKRVYDQEVAENNGDLWSHWWAGIDGGEPPLETTPGMLRKVMLPKDND